MNKADTIIKTTPRKFLSAHPSECWQFLRDAEGSFRAVSWFDINKLNAQEREEYEKCEAADGFGPSSYPPLSEEEEAAYASAHTPRFPTLALAEEWAELEDEEISTAEDLQAFHAPSECGTLAFSQIREAREALLLKQVRGE